MEELTMEAREKPVIQLAEIVTDELFVELLRGYEDVLYKMAYTYVGNEDDALEMVSEAVYRGYKHRKSLKNAAYFRTWITKILINLCLTHIKRSKKIVFQSETEELASRETPRGGEDAIVLADALMRLKAEYRTALLLRYYQDLSVEETAYAMDVPKNTVKTYTSRALTALRKFLKEDEFYD